MVPFDNGYSYRREIIIDNTKVSGSSDLSNFPALVLETDATLKTKAYSGKVENNNGYDIIFTSDSDGLIQLDHEIERYEGDTGKIVMWVRIPTLDYNNDTTIYMFYGNNTITDSQEKVDGVWDANYKGVWHLAEPSGTGSFDEYRDSAGQNHGRGKVARTDNPVGEIAPTQIEAKIGKGAHFEGQFQKYIDCGKDSTLKPKAAITISAWIRPETLSNGNYGNTIAGDDTGSPDRGCVLRLGTDNFSFNLLLQGAWREASGGSPTPHTNYYVVGTYRGGPDIRLYVDGVQVAGKYGFGGNIATADDRSFNIGASGGIGRFFHGWLDEVRVSDTNRSVAWILTEYNNQNDPSTFYSFGSEEERGRQEISACADIGRHYAYINTKGNIKATQTKTVRARTRILPTALFITGTEAGVRQIIPKLEIKWDGSSWVDESTYLISAKGNTKLNGEWGESVAAELDIELDNTTDRFDPSNTSSPLYAYIKPKVKIRLSLSMGTSNYYMKVFTGYIKAYTPKDRIKICGLHCFDNAQDLIDKTVRRSLYTDYRVDQLLETMVTDPDVGMVAGEYDFEISESIVHAAWFQDKKVWELMGELAITERGRIFFDENGILQFWNRGHLRNLPESAAVTLTRNDWIKKIDYEISEKRIRNRIIIKALPRSAAGVQQVWDNGEADVLDPYTDTLVGIPALESQHAFLELEDPCTDWVEPIPFVDYKANLEQDGSGIDVTEYVTISSWIPYDDAVWLTVNNSYNGMVYLTEFRIRANPVRVWKWIKADYKDEESISTYGEIKLELESDFIDTEALADVIATEELYRWKDAKSNFKASIIGIPYLRCGDVINVEVKDTEYEKYMVQVLDWTLDERGFNQTIELVDPIEIPMIQQIHARANIA